MLLDEVRDRIRFEAEHWIWTGAQQHGYGSIIRGGRRVQAHRAIYVDQRGPIPAGHVVDHICRVTLCVRPEHLEAVTNRENVMRGRAPTVLQHLSGVCVRGHVGFFRAGVGCLECRRARARRKWQTCAEHLIRVRRGTPLGCDRCRRTSAHAHCSRCRRRVYLADLLEEMFERHAREELRAESLAALAKGSGEGKVGMR